MSATTGEQGFAWTKRKLEASLADEQAKRLKLEE